MSRVKAVNENLMIRQTDPDSKSVIVGDKAIKLNHLSKEIINGLIPLGSVFAIMPHITGSYQPGVSGIVEGSFIRCDGAAIPAGMKVTGSTPDLTADNYLRGAGSSGATGGSNTMTIATPQLPVHSHSLTLGFENTPHTHNVNAMDAGNATHTHANTVVNNMPTMHNHIGTAVAANAPHTHTMTISTANAPHSHGSTIGSSNNPHSHPASITSSNINSPTHRHNSVSMATSNSPGPGYFVDFNDSNPGNGFDQGVYSGNNNVPHTHSQGALGTVNAPHSHPATAISTTQIHSHTSNSGSANVPHTHTIGITNDGSMPHSHTVTIDAGDMLHSHPVDADTADAPHSHSGSTIGNTGAGDILNREPQYMNCIYIMRVR